MKFAVRKRRAPVIIIVSLVDIPIILLIFFVVSTSVKKDQPEVQINLPESKTAKKQPAEAEHAIVSIDQNDELKLDGRAIGVDELEGAVRNLPETRKSTLALQADKKASFGTIIKVMDALAGGREKFAGVYPGREVILQILEYGDPILRAKGKPIENIDDRIRELAANMIETMHAANGVGLAAQQIGETLQLTVLDVSLVEDRPSTLKLDGKDVDPEAAMPLVLINPEIELRGANEVGVEGCLSFPEITGDIDRAKSVIVRAQTLEGRTIEIEASGFLARAIQHEADHLNGILFIDRMNSAAKAALSSRLKRLQKETRRGIRHREALVSETTL